MSYRILLADDSETIHKVMTYTFMNGPFELEIASTQDEVNQKLDQKSYDIILLDFGLSELFNGYEVAGELRGKTDRSSIVMLFGSFDTIDEGQLNEAGVRDRIIKPFDSQHLIKICEAIVQGKESIPIEENNPTLLDSNDQNWQIKKPTLPDLSQLTEGQLKKELEDWSVDIPPVIGAGQVEKDLSMTEDVPPVIEEGATRDITVQFKIPEEIVKNQEKVPFVKDLEYPELKIEVPSLPSVDEAVDKLPEEKTGKIKLPSLNELDIDSKEFDLNKTSLTPPMNKDGPDEIPPPIELNIDGDDPDKVEKEELSGNEMNVEDFWAFDEEDELKNENSGPISDEVLIDPPKVDIDNIMEKLKPFIEQSVHQYCKETIEKVAWEIIPDLAENIIKKEIQEIKDSVIK